ncbi:MAG: hypothetical protein IT461_16560 [Planctomycetes bacterium]|jgi:hypothetical protein|nr:hypothetical protein [Planctomycetota bacterium]
MAKKKSDPRTWGLLHGTVEEDYADHKRWANSFTDEEWDRLLDVGDREIRKLIAARKRKTVKPRRKKAA